MEKKTGLNNVQRKMLDEIYTEQFDKVTAPILQKRAEGLAKLKNEVLAEEAGKAPLKTAFAKINAAREAYESVEKYLQEQGLKFSAYRYRDREGLEFNTYSGIRHPKIAKYEDATREIEVKLANKKKEIRARIYGMDTTYEEVEKEISKEIASFKV